MGMLKNFFTDVGELTTGGPRKRLFGIAAAVVLLYLLADTRKFGDAVGDFITTHGLSIFNRTELSLEIDEHPPSAVHQNGSGGNGVALEVDARGALKPCRSGNRIEILLLKDNVQVGERPALVDSQCKWRGALTVTEPGVYTVEALSRGWWAADVRTSARLTHVSADAIDTVGLLKRYIDQEALASRRAKNTDHGPRAVVSVFYLDQPAFSRYVFEAALVGLNSVLTAIEFQIVDSAPDLTTGTANSGALLDHVSRLKTEAAKDAAKRKEPAPLAAIGITARVMEDEENGSDLYYLVRRGGLAVISTSNTQVFSTETNPTVYRYLLTMLVEVGAVKARHPDLLLELHDETDGCFYDVSNELARAQMVVGHGYLCAKHYNYFERSGMSARELTDLTSALPVTWLR